MDPESIKKKKKSKANVTNLPVAFALFSGSQEVRASANPIPNSCARVRERCLPMIYILSTRPCPLSMM